MNYKHLIDSSAWVHYFDEPHSGELKRIIEQGGVATSIIAIAELANKFDREGKPFEKTLAFIRSKGLILPVTLTGAVAAARIKNERRATHPKFGMADALQLATAIERRLMLITTDNDFSGVGNVMLIRK